MSGKGDRRRPKQISEKEEQRRWDETFGKCDPNLKGNLKSLKGKWPDKPYHMNVEIK